MSFTEVLVEGTLRADGTLELSEKPDRAPGRVTVVLRQESPTAAGAAPDESVLERRRALTGKFVSGEWGVELAGYKEARAADGRKAAERANAWRG